MKSDVRRVPLVVEYHAAFKKWFFTNVTTTNKTTSLGPYVRYSLIFFHTADISGAFCARSEGRSNAKPKGLEQTISCNLVQGVPVVLSALHPP